MKLFKNIFKRKEKITLPKQDVESITSNNLRKRGFEISYADGEVLWLFSKPLKTPSKITVDRYETDGGIIEVTFQVEAPTIDVKISMSISKMSEMESVINIFETFEGEEVKSIVNKTVELLEKEVNDKK